MSINVSMGANDARYDASVLIDAYRIRADSKRHKAAIAQLKTRRQEVTAALGEASGEKGNIGGKAKAPANDNG